MAHNGSSSKTRIPLRGYERMMTMADDGCMKLVHVMAVRGCDGAIAAFLAHLPQALVRTFNRHPRMRAMQVRGEFAMAEIQAKLTLETISEHKLLEVREIGQQDNGDDAESWEKYVEDEWQIPLDRYSELPYFVRVWHYPGQDLARVMLFCDHYMSDGISGMAVLNDIVTFASELSRERQQALTPREGKDELPLRPSLYDMWMGSKPLTLFLSKIMVKLFGKMIYVDEVKRFHPIITPRADQADMMVPIKINSSSALFGQGTGENMKNALRRCKDEGVTFFGALAAAVVVAYFVACDDEKRDASSPFKLTFELPINMRSRVSSPVPEVQVGAYMASNGLDSFSKKGVDMCSVRFWDLARKTKRELDELLESILLPLPLLFLDKFVNSNLKQEFLKGIRVPYSLTADINVSNMGRYAYTTTHTFLTPDNQLADLTIESVHAGNANPHVGSAATIYVTSIDQLSYVLMHKYDDAQGKRLFAAMVASIEHIGNVGAHETMIEVASAVQKSL